MTFTRTRSGLKNFRHFFGADLTLYVEGRLQTDLPIEDPTRPDAKFYNALCSEYLPGRRVKVKLTGNRRSALEYHKKIVGSSIPNSLVMVDRDYDGLLLTPLVKPKLILTYGYSWENDFWTESLFLNTLSFSTASDANVVNLASMKLQRTMRRLAKLSALNAAAHINGESIFPSKKKSRGLNIDASLRYPISRLEYKRLSSGLKNMCQVMKSVHRSALKAPQENIIQGHLLEYVSLFLLSYIYTMSTSTVLKNNSILVNIALSLFSENPGIYISTQADNYYRAEFARAI
ncbi:TPA: DUF4435 domain-containing protein [Pseudomonas aeruginosa]|uniref:DUF4435 domain-containing protein n=1 Tax=Pseudomonas aeruginosa TaxID=287 RepID=UPI000B48BDF0|nr:DUF4435 domain-containing protein [Pseudomonas aeruginosa]EKV0210278.1 DUF4435 domain-containing protein [Pseudomonas aeruginosa]EKX5067005.1 DUF4435 domain-containing protein [Pseudomonas aeruginosa]ELB6598667.1 DUF4435 domain-containing protein [Pseudomonas aeruginosa]ELH7225605.1 DUF4435 domain-containing protein [Pseudomonas aeruginosa]ELQ8314487.1 DUF4435 domain-containing protein [Pseudomonas aeruginosa]